MQGPHHHEENHLSKKVYFKARSAQRQEALAAAKRKARSEKFQALAAAALTKAVAA